MRSRINDNKIQQRDTLSRLLRCVLPLLLSLIVVRAWGQSTPITSLSDITSSSGNYVITQDIDATGFNSSIASFSGTLEADINPGTHMPYKITNLGAPLFTTLTGTVKNIVLEDVGISGYSGNTGAIACTANGSARIYNVGILSGSVGGTKYTGGLVGLLDGTARVINCYSYATITGGTNVGGIVGYNNVTTTAASVNTIVMNCMFYGDITGGTTVSPVYGGTNINNLNSGGLNTFNYYAYDKLKTNAVSSGKYNCALAVEDKYLTRFEYYRLLLNSNKKLAAYYATGSMANGGQMLKWVLETADRSIANPKPYPILKSQGTYPSIVNYDANNAPDSVSVGRNHGGKIGTLSVTVSESNTTAGGQTKPTGATVGTTSLTLVRTDKDFDRFNFNYDKVQLPYYNDIGSGNYTENKVVTGWKITGITTVANDPYTATNYPAFNAAGIAEYPNYNFADRKSSQKDLYSVSSSVFSQGAYFDVPYGVTSITIEPYWGKAAYVSDEYLDVVYNTSYSAQSVTQLGKQFSTGKITINSSEQVVKTKISDALGTLNGVTNPTVYDYAVVLVGNLHQASVPANDTKPFTIMSVDLDNDHEPDYSMVYHHTGKKSVSPIRFDFLNIPGTAQAQKPNGANDICNMGIIEPRGWFEITNTSSIYFSQFEYENLNDVPSKTKAYSPLILQGGIFDQFVSTNSLDVPGYTVYIHVGGNVWIKELGMGTHSDGSKATPHVPISVTGGEYPGFYLTGTYNQDAAVSTDNAKCYISGGHFGEAAGAGQEAINGNVRWQIYNADIDNFYGGGTNGATDKNIKGNITVDIFNSHVTTYCGGPKFGNMESGKQVTTNAEGCVFGTFFGAGYGGTAYSRKKYYDATGVDWTNWAQKYIDDRGKYFDGVTTYTNSSSNDTKKYGKKGIGVATELDYEFFVWSSGKTGGRFFVKFASFSLAQCNNVNSTLTGCTVNENFYGGGSLGKVVGEVTSTLTDCTIHGSVFGAGYSATLPTLEVREAGFTTNPNYNKNSGLFEPAELSGTTTFTWKNATEAGVTLSNGNSGSDLTNHYVYTDVELNDLGTVSNNITLTLNGTTTVGTLEGTTLKVGTGNVYGGGDESAVNGNITVTLRENTEVLGNVFGGGNQGYVSGSTNVLIED